MQVPWAALGRVPVEVRMDRLYVLASPKSDAERGKGIACPVSEHASSVL